MTLLGFNLGTTTTASGGVPGVPTTMVDMSLDDMIKQRRKEAKTGSAAGLTVSEKAGAMTRARKDARMRARRGLSDNKKATAMDVEKAIQKVVVKKAEKMVAEKPKKGAKGQEKAQDRKARARAAKTVTEAKKKVVATTGVTALASLPRPPPKRAVRAAVQAMQKSGFEVPDGMQMVISFAPKPGAAVSKPPTKKPAAKQEGGPKNENRPSQKGGKPNQRNRNRNQNRKN